MFELYGVPSLAYGVDSLFSLQQDKHLYKDSLGKNSSYFNYYEHYSFSIKYIRILLYFSFSILDSCVMERCIIYMLIHREEKNSHLILIYGHTHS